MGRNRRKRDEPIITSVLDTDKYYDPMAMYAHTYHPDAIVDFAYRCRTKGVNMGEILDMGEIREQFEHLRSLAPTDAEMRFLAACQNNGQQLLTPTYLDHRRTVRFPEFLVAKNGTELDIWFHGPYDRSLWGETPGLAIVSELYNERLARRYSDAEMERRESEAIARLNRKLDIILQHPSIKIMEFGTRRRYSRLHQQRVVEIMMERLGKQYVGSSNEHLSRIFGTDPKGTNAHAVQMVIAALLDNGDPNWLRKAVREYLDRWWTMFGYDMFVFLPDTFSTDFFLECLTEEDLRRSKGARHDSGDVFRFIDKWVERYRRFDIDPMGKAVLPSDGLDVPMMIAIDDYTKGKIKVMADGWGTTATNDVWDNVWASDGFWEGPISQVVKPFAVNGRGTVKLSDNLAKATGRPEDVERYKCAAGYTNTDYVECKV